MFHNEADNKKIGKYLKNLIEQNFKSQRTFCISYLKLQQQGKEPTPDEINNMANRLSQIIKGKNSLQFYDLPYFTELLNISCEHILSAGECGIPTSNRVTNYSIAGSTNPEVWEAYVNREDKLILNCDEYRKTVLDYALEFGNYAFLKYLMDNKYIWFDSLKDNDHVPTANFGVGTSIDPRKFPSADYSLFWQLETEDKLRTDLVALAADNNDIEMLNRLRARENPQIYTCINYLHSRPDFDSCYNKRMVEHIADSSEEVLDYFTTTFEITASVRYKNANPYSQRFIFPYISKLLDLLIRKNSSFAETALKKAIQHNKSAYKKLSQQISKVLNDEEISKEHYAKSGPGLKPVFTRDVRMNCCRDDLRFYENGDIIMFYPLYSFGITELPLELIITNVARVTKIPTRQELKQLAEELNQSYLAIKNIKEHLEEI